MKFRTKLFLIVAITIAITVALVTWAVSSATSGVFEQADQERTQALIGQFRREFSVESDDILRRVAAIAESARTKRMAVRLVRASNYPRYVNEATELASSQRLDFLELVAADGTIVSSAHWPARFGYKNTWVTESSGWSEQGAFLGQVELADGPALALLAVREAPAGDSPTYVIGGTRLDSAFLESLVLPEGMRALLYRNLSETFALEHLSGARAEAEALRPLIEDALATGAEQTKTVEWETGAESFHAIPLSGLEDNLLAVLLVGSSRERVAEVSRLIRGLGVLVGAVGLVLGLALSWWATARVTRPVQQLGRGAAEVASGNWDARVEADSTDEMGDLARAFNRMTEQLAAQRERLIQSERVAAWRELARRLAHELKNPLFPMQITVENARKAKQQHPDQFDEVFQESTDTLLT
ncbi:MAG: HAMP domain-containing protein, partial [bacterium]|nr:HAMP domain-containing protein [bacterium]